MAAGSADAFSATPRGFGCYDRELISDNLWTSSVVATASTGASWVDEVHNSDSVEKRWEDIKRKFHGRRVLQIKHLPREATEEEVRELLSEWDVQSVLIQSGSARVSLSSPEVLEDWDRNATFTLRGQRVTIVPSPTEMLLCIGKLPMSYSEAQFNNLVGSYGEVRRAFLMISERTGESKGYGFVEYVTKEAALQAKNALDGKRILDCIAVCDWLDSSHVTVRSLHSKCLLVDRLPPNYRDMGEFRRVFSAVVNPPYCQIALRNGCPQDWGLVEFINEEDAEKTQEALDGYSLHGSHIRVSYYIPGVRAINLYLKLLNDGGANKGKSALLPDPPAPAVFQQLQSLAKQNPVFAQNLQTIIMQQIQDLQKGKPGMPEQQNKRQPYQNKGSGGSYNLPQNNSPPNHNLMKNAQQTALTLLLASQMQQSGQLSPGGNNPSVSLQNQQQLFAALQAMTKQGGSGGNDQFLNGLSAGVGCSSTNYLSNLTNILGLVTQQPNNTNGVSPISSPLLEPTQNHSQPFYPSQGSLLSPQGGGSKSSYNNEDHWSGFKSPSRSTSVFGNNGMHKSPLLPSPSSPLEVPMDTGISAPKTPPGDSLQAMWYSLFGQSSSASLDSTPPTPGDASPLFMKNNSMLNGSNGSPMGRSADALFGMNQLLNNKGPGGGGGSGGGFSTSHSPIQHRGVNGDLQEALTSLLNNPQNLNQILGQSNQPMNPHSSDNMFNTAQMHNRILPPNNQLQRQNSFSGGGLSSPDLNGGGGGVPNALLDLLMHSMKNESSSSTSDAFGGFKNNSWSSGSSSPPSPIGNSRGGGYPSHQSSSGLGQPQRSGSNGSSEMSSSSPRSPTYSPFSRNSSKGLLESGNGNAPNGTSTWSNTMLGSFIGGTPPQVNNYNSQSRNIWAAPSLSPGVTSQNNSSLMNNLGIKRKVLEHGENQKDCFLSNSNGPIPLGHNNTLNPNNHGHPESPHHHHLSIRGGGGGGSHNDHLVSQYADSYFKKKKKN